MRNWLALVHTIKPLRIRSCTLAWPEAPSDGEDRAANGWTRHRRPGDWSRFREYVAARRYAASPGQPAAPAETAQETRRNRTTRRRSHCAEVGAWSYPIVQFAPATRLISREMKRLPTRAPLGSQHAMAAP
jgi:hypothetical protein